MNIIITSTDQLTTMEGYQVRVWEGVTEAGVKCKVFVHRLAVHNDDDSAEFDRELRKELPPCRYLPLSLIL